MKKTHTLMVCLLACVALIMTGCQNTLFGRKKMHVLKDQGIVDCEIVVPADAGPVPRFAAKELKKFLDQSLAGDVAIIKAPTGNKTAIILGNNSLLQQAGIDVKQLVRDGFMIQSRGNRIFIAGIDDPAAKPERRFKRGGWGMLFQRGTLNGVYDFLERCVGVRFYFPGKMGTIVPKHERLVVDEMDIIEKPDYTTRKYSWGSGITPDGLHGKASVPFKALNVARLRMETEYIPNCHGLARLGYLTRYGKSNPEYFTLMSNGKRYNNPAQRHAGQICLSSGIREQIYQDAKALLTGVSAKDAGILTGRFGYCWDASGFQPGYFNIMPQDSFYKCRCPKCWRHFSAGQQASSDFVWDMVIDTAERLKKNNIPGYLTNMAYGCYRPVPTRDIPDNVLVMLAETGPWALHIPDVAAKEKKEVKAWVDKQGKKIWLWNYANKVATLDIPGVPATTPRAVGNYYKQQVPYIFGAFLESETDRFIYNYLNYYMFSKICWDNSASVDAILSEHYQVMFGDAASVMEKIYDKFEKKWLTILGKPIDTPRGPTAIPVSDYELWEHIYSKSEIGSIDDLFDEAERLTKKAPEVNARVAFIREKMFAPLKKNRAKYLQNKQQISDLTFHMKRVPAKDKIAVDGSLDDSAWKQSEKIYLRPFGKYKGMKDAALKTVVRALQDDKNYYFSFWCEEPRMDKIVTAKRPFDQTDIWRDSSVELFMNPSGDKKKYYQILVNASGSISDLAAKKVGAGQVHNWKWNSGACVATSRGKDYWSAEIEVPKDKLEGVNINGFPVNFNRNRIVLSVDKNYVPLFTWSPFLKHGFHEIENFGSIRFKGDKTENLVKNGDFTEAEKGRRLGAWFAAQKKNLKKGESWRIVNDTFMKGGQCLELHKATDEGKLCVTQYLPTLKPNTEYLLTYFVRLKDVSHSKYGVCVNIGDDQNRWFPQNFYKGTIPWTKQGFKFKTRPGTNKNYKSFIRLWLMGSSGTAWFDDVKLKEIKRK